MRRSDPVRGIRLLVILLLGVWGWRAAEMLPRGEPSPQSSSDPSAVFVLLGEGFPRPGIHQFHDGITPGGVIKMAAPGVSFKSPPDPLLLLPLSSGEVLDIVLQGSQIAGIKRYWMPAGMQITLFIPLHPDRMTADDWEVLPGIGQELARRIEEDRQKNGDFGSLKSLARVRGIGPKLVGRLKPYFEKP
ncbi:MAG: helix-hairpin-helix domain-containing protein [Desulfuromonadaceae bacterium]|nr:helix-hairpin-helix domain-containing protein [Desulfuromonadaceae bacterium]